MRGMIVYLKKYKVLLQKVKPTFFERRNSSLTLFDEFARLARSEKGALLFAVVGGKLSEGIFLKIDILLFV